jgi:hypothetical protein
LQSAPEASAINYPVNFSLKKFAAGIFGQQITAASVFDRWGNHCVQFTRDFHFCQQNSPGFGNHLRFLCRMANSRAKFSKICGFKDGRRISLLSCQQFFGQAISGVHRLTRHSIPI